MEKIAQRPICVTGFDQYLSSNEVVLGVVRRVMPKAGDNTIFVTDMNNNTVFKIVDMKTSFFSLHKERALVDAHGTTLLTFRSKVMSSHYRWRVFRGKSKENNDIIFTSKQSSICNSRKNYLKVFLKGNKSEKKCDFMVGSSCEDFCVGNDIKDIIAKAEDFKVRVKPHVDQIFIVSLIVILDGMNEQLKEERGLSEAASSAGATVGANIGSAFA